MGRQSRPRQRRFAGAPDGAQQHRDWLSLVEIDGPFLSLPLLRAAWPTLDALDKPTRQSLRIQHAKWQADTTAGQRDWIRYVLCDLLEWGNELCWNDGAALDAFAMDVAEHDARIAPAFALIDPHGEIKPASTRLLGVLCQPDTQPTARIKRDPWVASPVDRLARLCRFREVQLGLVTDGRWWTLLWADRGRVTTTATFDAIGWSESAELDVVRAFVSLLCRRRFFGVPSDETLVALLRASEDSQEEITGSLGVQVRQAVELLVAAIGRADTAQRQHGAPGLAHVDAREIYRGAVSVMMRIVFLLFAEERKLLPSDNELYATSYSVGQLCAELERRALETSEDHLEHSFASWHRLVALFDAVYYGVEHKRLRMYPHDGSLFDTATFPWFPLTIDDRTVLHVLRAVQYVEIGTGNSRERRKLSFLELDVEQIGYVYEGLLAYDGFRAEDVTVGLVGKRGFEKEVALRELEGLAAHSSDVPQLATTIAETYKESGIGSARAVERKLAPLPVSEGEDARRRLLSVTRGDYALTNRLLRFYGITRRDLRGLPVVIMRGELFITESPLRKYSGTHYTPRRLADRVAEGALKPLVYTHGPLQSNDASTWRQKSSKEILALRVVDIAMGSGAFLVAAARYLAERLVEARIREGDEGALLSQISRVVDDTDEDEVVIQARREIIEHCLYGVDINPAAVEISKVSLWLISMDPNLPLTFLDDRLKAGDSLLGITSEEQLWHMHVYPDIGEHVHNDLFQWVAPGRALLGKVADGRLRVVEIEVRDDPLARLAEKRKMLEEIARDTAQLRLIGDLLIASTLANSTDGARGLTQAAVEAARLASIAVRDGDEDNASDHIERCLRTDLPAIGFPRAPFHWPLEFPEVFRNGGFDAVIGNKPYLGGQKLTGVLGGAYREYLVHVLAGGVRGSADLIAYFALRAYRLLNDAGTMGLVATNTLAQGDTREVGLDQLTADGVTIYDATKSMPWPSKSSVLECCVVCATRARVADDAERITDGVVVPGITSSLDAASRTSGSAHRLAANASLSFIGSYVLGMGFTMDPRDAQALIATDARNGEVLFPYLNGQDLNSDPGCAASRWVINFQDWPLDRASNYPECYDQVVRLVKPERERNNDKRRREIWWRFTRPVPELYARIKELDRVIVITLISKTLTPALVPARQVFAHKLGVFATDDPAMLALLSCAPHYWWTVRRSSTMKTDINYSPSDAFETFPMPGLTDEMRQLGGRLDAFRGDVMLSRQTGLTKTYNLVFDPNCTDEDVEELRAIHRSIDEATIRAYGWINRIEAVGGFEHGFHMVGRGIRYTIGPAAQREILDSLLELNHERYAAEVARGLHGKKRKARRRSPNDQVEMFP